VGDLTFLRTEMGFLYLSLLTDKFSHKVVGYHCGETLEAGGCLVALKNALTDLPAGVHPMHHTDQGSQYCSHEYVGWAQAHGLSISMTESDHCAENALAERMNGILKSEYGLGGRFQTKASARLAVAQAVHLYNTRRPPPRWVIARHKRRMLSRPDQEEGKRQRLQNPVWGTVPNAPLRGSAPAR
jgi:transposase InsO family protein